MGTRESILANLTTRITASGAVTTVKRSLLSDVEIRKYTRSQLPALFVIEPDSEPPEYSGSQHAVNTLTVDLKLYLEQWDWDGAGPTQINSVRDAVINAVHSDITNGVGACFTTDCIPGETVRDHPLYLVKIRVVAQYYQSYLSR